MIEGSCHCGGVRYQAPEPPADLTSCNCSICRRLGTLWAYYPSGGVSVSGETDSYVWGDEMLALHRCKVCGCVTHWTPTPKGEPGRMGLNARLMPREVFEAARVRRFDGADTWEFLD